MAPTKQEWKPCSHCGRKEATPDDKERKGFEVKITEKSGMHHISCPCGIITKLCRDKLILHSVWDSRPNKPVKIPVITVTHSKTAKVDPSLLDTGDDKTDIPDVF